MQLELFEQRQKSPQITSFKEGEPVENKDIIREKTGNTLREKTLARYRAIRAALGEAIERYEEIEVLLDEGVKTAEEIYKEIFPIKVKGHGEMFENIEGMDAAMQECKKTLDLINDLLQRNQD